MVIIRNEKPCKVNDTVWCFDAYGNLTTGRIYEIKDGMAYIACGRTGGMKTGARLSECWPTKEACLDAEKQRSDKQVAEYKARITDIESLVAFLFNHDIHSEYRDQDAEVAARERAAELGVSIEIN